jgi:hypothetical protein
VIDRQAAKVILDPLPELGRPVVPEHPARCVPPRAHLADQGQVVGVGVQRGPDELISNFGAIEIGSVDVIDPEVGRAP